MIASRDQELIGIVLYGSRARGDADQHSDTDVCVVTADVLSHSSDAHLKNRLRAWVTESAELSVYTMSEFLKMVRNGSLFSWHLKLEGHVLWSKGAWIEWALSQIGSYRRAVQDIQGYRLLMEDISKSLRHSTVVNVFDLAMLFTVARNTCMVLAFLGGRPTFGRTKVFSTASAIYGVRFDFRPSLYDLLLRWKLWYVRGYPPEQCLPSTTEALQICQHVQMLIAFALMEARNGTT